MINLVLQAQIQPYKKTKFDHAKNKNKNIQKGKTIALYASMVSDENILNVEISKRIQNGIKELKTGKQI